MPYLARRLILALLTVLGVALFVFVLMRVVPGDVVQMRYAEGTAPSRELLAQERARLGLDRPLGRQLRDWLAGLAVLDFGRSMWSGAPIVEEVAARVPLTLELAILATLISVLVALPLGVLAAVKQDTWVDHTVRLFAIAGLATPSFWLGILMIIAFLSLFRWLPPLLFVPFWEDPWQNLSQMVWPALAVGYRYSAVATRMTRSAMLEVLRSDFVRTATAKGLSPLTVVGRHALRNALLPVLTVIGLEFAFLTGGLVVVEQVFNLNGLGLLFVQAVTRRDYTVIQSLVLLTAAFYVAVNLLVDLCYQLLDPRIEYR
jgi:peptide/nickel transport system permease protein